MTVLLLSAGRATRLGDLAPSGCKAAMKVGDRTMIDWVWETFDERPVVVCRPEHGSVISKEIPTVTTDEGGGPAVAVAKALAAGAIEGEAPVTIIYADTWIPVWGIPHEPEFCGVAAGFAGRAWDVVEGGTVTYRHVTEAALVCIGLYRFTDSGALADAVGKAMANAEANAEVGMGDVVNAYGLPFVPVLGWQDTGDQLALARWRPL